MKEKEHKEKYLKKIKELLDIPEDSHRLDFILTLKSGQVLALGMMILKKVGMKTHSKADTNKCKHI